MSYSFSAAGNSQNIATELIVSVYDQVEAGFYDALYPELLWKTAIPEGSIKTDINPGAINYVYRSRDVKGTGQFVQGSPANIPRVGQVVGQVTVPILDAAVGATLTNADASKIAQIVFLPCGVMTQVGDVCVDTARGDNGFNSSGLGNAEAGKVDSVYDLPPEERVVFL